MTQPKYPELRDPDWLRQKYVVEHLSATDISHELRCTHTTVLAALRAAGIERRGRDQYPTTYPRLRDEAWLRRRYVEEGRTTREIAYELGCNHVTVSEAMRRLGVTPRARGPRPGGQS